MFSYVLYFPTSVVGPSFEFTDFRNFINLQNEYSDIPKNLAIKEGFREFGKSIMCMIIYIGLKNPFKNTYCITDEFGEKSYFYKVKNNFYP